MGKPVLDTARGVQADSLASNMAVKCVAEVIAGANERYRSHWLQSAEAASAVARNAERRSRPDPKWFILPRTVEQPSIKTHGHMAFATAI